MQSVAMKWLIFALIVRLGFVECGSTTVTISAFNIQIFGTTKYSETAVVDVLSSTAIRYDALYIEELKDTPDNSCGVNTGPVICGFLNQVNAKSSVKYQLVVSERVGNGSQEQYALLYKPTVFNVLSQYEYDQGTTGQFLRPPSITHLSPKANSDISFYVTHIHTSPDSAVSEVYCLTNVSKSIKSDYQIILGDFNSDGSYFNEKKDWPYFFSVLPNFYNSIDDTIDTTVHDTNNYTYDRMVLSPSMQSYYVKGSAKPFHFDNVSEGGFSMSAIKQQGCSMGYITSGCPNSVTDNEAALEVSDHYPVELKFTFPTKSAAEEDVPVIIN